MKQLTIAEFRKDFLHYLDLTVLHGEIFEIQENGIPFARLEPVPHDRGGSEPPASPEPDQRPAL